MYDEPDEDEVQSYYEQAATDGCAIVAAVLLAWIVFSPFIFGG